MKRVLILTASYGSGHNAAARCLAPAFERERCLVTVVDHFRELVSPLFERARGALEERGDQLAEVVHHRHQAPLALEGRGQAPRRGVVARSVAGGEDEHAFHGGLMVAARGGSS